MARDASKFVRDSLKCTVAEDRQPGKQAFLEIVHLKRRQQLVAFDIQTITPRTKSGNLKVLAMIYVMTRFVRVKSIPDEKAETIALVLVEEWISVFGPMEGLLTDGRTNVVSQIVKELAAMLGIGCTQTYSLHSEANGTVERWNWTIAWDLQVS